MINSEIIKNIADAIRETDKKTTAYDAQATVRRIEGNTAWVHIPGGVDETPVRLTMNAKEGDTVQVRVSGGSAFLIGNATAPPTDDTEAVKAKETAHEAKTKAVEAYETAETAMQDAQTAHEAAAAAVVSADQAATAASNAQTSADNAQASADAAQTSADTAQTSADAAQVSANHALSSAINANEYASRALGNLSTVQSVAETLTWITEHGTMTPTTDVTPDPTHVYFVRDNNGDYQVGSYKYSIVNDPDPTAMSSYYELSIDESLNNYVGTHLALTNEGLWLLPAGAYTDQQMVDSSNNELVDHAGNLLVMFTAGDAQYATGYKVLIATGAGTTYTTPGTYIIDSIGGVVAKYTASEITIGDILNENINISSSGMAIRDGQDELATFSDSLIELGKNSTSSAVKMCGGLAEITYQYGQYVEDGILIQASNNDSSLMKLAELCFSALSKSGNDEENVYIKLSAGVGGSPVLSTISLVADTIDFNGNVRFMSATTWTAPTVVSNQATIIHGGFYSEGKRTYVQMEIRLAAELTGDTTLSEFLEGFPVPTETLAVLSIATGGGGYGFASVKTNGKMNIRLNKTTGTSTNIYITGVYTTA